VGSKNHQRTRGVRVVAMGGGTGLSTMLRGLKEYVARRKSERARWPIADLTAVVTVTDDGGSSGRLRREYSVLPPGDIRNCMVALSKDEHLLSKLFQYRFASGRGLRGHSFGNLFLTALTHIIGDFPGAVQLSGQVLAIRGRIFPLTAENVNLEAELENGQIVRGETNISHSHWRIKHLRLKPVDAKPLPEVLSAIREADLILIGPGSLYTSLIPNLLLKQVKEVLLHARGTRVYIANLMTQPGETDGYSVADHVRALYAHTREGLFDWVVVNRKPVSPRVLRRYRAKGAEPVSVSAKELQKMGVGCVSANLLQDGDIIRHDQKRLTQVILDEFVKRSRGR
jgi:uncharacterized cofD-like protein